jgi:hypothetical protein
MSRCYFDQKFLKQRQETLNSAETVESFLKRGGKVVKVAKSKSGLKASKPKNKINGLKLLQAAKGTIHEKQVIKLLRAKGIEV